MIPEECEKQCLLSFDTVEEPCDQCLAWYAHWCEVDDSEMDIDWSEYSDLT